jgi:hypothetical protein
MTAASQGAEIERLEEGPPLLAVRRAKGGGQFRWDSVANYAPIFARWVDENYAPVKTIGPYEILILSDQ